MRYRIEFSTPEELMAKAKILQQVVDLEKSAAEKLATSPDTKHLHKYLEIKEIKNAPKRKSPNTPPDII